MNIEVLERMFQEEVLVKIPSLVKLETKSQGSEFRRNNFFMSVKEEGKSNLYFYVRGEEGSDLRDIFNKLFKDSFDNNHLNVFIKGSNTRIVFEDGMYMSRHIEDVPTYIFKRLIEVEGIKEYDPISAKR